MSKKYLANKDDVYTKVDTDNFLVEKANKSEVYTKSETNNAITSKVAEIVSGAPEDFDTLKEMSDWIAGHENDAATMNSAIKTNATNISSLQTDKVGFTDYATASKTGVIKVNNTYGTSIKNGTLEIISATEDDINAGSNDWKPITPYKVPKVMKKYGINSETQITEMQEDIKNKVDNDIFVAENLIKYPYAQMFESRLSVQFTYDDGVITLNGISNDGSTDTVTVMNLYTHFTLKDGQYTLSANSSSSNIGVRLYGHDEKGVSTVIKTVYGNSVYAYDTTSDGYSEYSLNLRVLNNYNGTEFVNDTCKPMFEIGNVAHAYQPYSLSRKAIRDDIDSLMALLTNKG